MEKIKQYKYIILIALIILGISFYWFQIRPSQIKKECSSQVEKMRKTGKDGNGIFNVKLLTGERESVNGAYSDCLRKNGI